MNKPIRIPFGNGTGYYAEEFGQVAHNSFINSYIEIGLFGGGAFLLAFLTAGRMIYLLGKDARLDPWSRVTREFLFALLCGFATGMYSLSREYVVPTYLVLGLCAAFLAIAQPTTPERYQINRAWFWRALCISATGFLFLKFFTQIASNLGV